VVKKKDEKEDLYDIGKKKLNVKAKAFVAGEEEKKKEEKKKETDPEKVILNHTPETISFFEQVKVATPFYLADLEKVIKNLEERKTYYENPPEEDMERHREQQKEKARPHDERPRHHRKEVVFVIAINFV
jgi:hypothetical protein